MERAKQKEKAIELIYELNLHKDYIIAFKHDDTVTMFERYIGFWAYQYPELMQKIKEIENRYKVLVYAVTHEYTDMGEMYSFLIVSNYKSEWKYCLEKGIHPHEYIAYAYVWNKDVEEFSEFGSIGIKKSFGGITRTA